MFNKRLIITSLAVLLSACSLLSGKTPDVTQGTIIDEKLLDQLHPGMTKKQVIAIVGTPLIQETFANNRLDYIYSVAKHRQPIRVKTLSCHFKNNKLTKCVFTGNKKA